MHMLVGFLAFYAPMRPPLPAITTTVLRSRQIDSVFSPAYDTTLRYAAADWAKNLRTLPRSMILKRIASPLQFNFAITVAICAFHTSRRFGPLGPVTVLPHTLLGNALGLLLVFRTNAAYSRFWEARVQWGTVTSECRELAGLACTFMTPQQALPLLALTAAFPVAMKEYLRCERTDRDRRRLRALLQAEEWNALKKQINQPQYILSRLRQLAHQSGVAGVTEKEREVLLKSVAKLGDCVCTCERIFNTVSHRTGLGQSPRRNSHSEQRRVVCFTCAASDLGLSSLALRCDLRSAVICAPL